MEKKEEEKETNIYVVPKKPIQKIKIIPKTMSSIQLIEVDDESDSSQNEGKPNTSAKNKEKCFADDNSYLSDDRYEDSFDEEFGDGCETNPDSGKMKLAEN